MLRSGVKTQPLLMKPRGCPCGYRLCSAWRGFKVHECESIRELRQRRMDPANVDAVIMVEDIVSIPLEVITASKSYSHGPIILFESQYLDSDKNLFDLRVPNLTAPCDWLQQIESVINEYHSCRPGWFCSKEKSIATDHYHQ